MCKGSKKGATAATAAGTAAASGRYSDKPVPDGLPSAADLRKAIPKHCFNKSIPMSMMYLVRDMGIAAGLMYGFHQVYNNAAQWEQLGLAGQAGLTAAYWAIEGFIMWCIFVVGHDCGHGSFSNYQWFNDIMGHITHGSILVPYWPWQRSHHMHHSYHNNIGNPGPVKDMSHQWFHPTNREQSMDVYARIFEPIRFLLPVIGWGTYVLFAEGGHFTPFIGPLWEGASLGTRVKCLVSGAVVAAMGAAVVHTLEYNPAQIMMVYGGPWFVFSWWLFTVTYLQHHHPESVVYEDAAWSYIKGAFETVDRKYGMGIDNFHHNITDGHVAHHIFFTKIPHYHLLEATEAIKDELKRRNAEDWYLFRDNTMFSGHWYVTEVWRQMHNHYFRANTWIKAGGKSD
uniref:Fatty acid desaturase domain-containing protein n=1 Tax=Phaeomonas parva TaxID=124430 RepID=A0A7S1Y036_9STRA|mmetsp:Transcript_6255/g.17504  ORF Transcript_6255/g.17504 Transcript_6255/m.17504 type:complete len:398 (+) Transcript_6255:154-1347(+)